MKESGKKSSVEGIPKQRSTNSRKESFPKEGSNCGHRSNNGQIISVPSFDNESDISERSSEINSRRLKHDLELALRGSPMTSDSNGKINESELKQKGTMYRSSSTGEAESDNVQQKRLAHIDKLRPQTVKEQGSSTKAGRVPPPKPPRVQPPVASDLTNKDLHSSEVGPPKVPKLPLAYDQRNDLMSSSQLESSFDEGTDTDAVDFVMVVGKKSQTRVSLASLFFRFIFRLILFHHIHLVYSLFKLVS